MKDVPAGGFGFCEVREAGVRDDDTGVDAGTDVDADEADDTEDAAPVVSEAAPRRAGSEGPDAGSSDARAPVVSEATAVDPAGSSPEGVTAETPVGGEVR